MVSKETIEEPKAESEGEAEAEEAKRWFETEWVRALWVITTEMHLMRKAQEKMVNECAKISENVAYLVSDLDLIVEGKWYMRTCLHRLVDGETESPPLGAKVPKPETKKSKDTAEAAAQEDMTMKE